MSPDANAGRTSTTSPAGQNTDPPRARLHLASVSHVDGEVSAVRLPPHDVDLERALLGVAILHGDYPVQGSTPLLEDVIATGLDAPDFYVPAHGRVWAAILDLHQEGTAVDVYTVASRCRDRNDVLGLLQVHESTVRTPAPVWARLLIDYGRCRAALPLVEDVLGELLAGRLREVRRLIAEVGEVLAA